MIGSSRLYGGPLEGIYVRRDAEGTLVARAKVVRPEFLQADEEHWSLRAMQRNALART